MVGFVSCVACRSSFDLIAFIVSHVGGSLSLILIIEVGMYLRGIVEDPSLSRQNIPFGV